MSLRTPKWGVWFFLLLISLIIWHKPFLKIYFILDYQKPMVELCRTHELDPALISAMIFTESRFNPTAKSHKGAIGLLQIMPSTGNWVAGKQGRFDFSKERLIDPEYNLEIGIWYLAYLKRYFNGHDYLALAAYNAGFKYVTNWTGQGIWNGDPKLVEQIPFPETKKYLIRIIFLKKIYRYLYPELS